MSHTINAVPKVVIKVEGSRAPTSVEASLRSVIVHHDVETADYAIVELNNEGLLFSESDYFDPGKKLQLEFGYEDGETGLVFEGEVTGSEASFPMRGAKTFRALAMDKTHRLQRKWPAKSFLDAKFEDVVKKLASDAGLSPKTDSSDPGVLAYHLAPGRRTLTYLRHVAYKLNFELEVEGDTLKFRKVPIQSSGSVKLKWGETLRSFNPRTSLSHQHHQVEVRGWDPKTKEVITHTAKDGDLAKDFGCSQKGLSEAKKVFGGESGNIYVHEPIFIQKEAEALAKAHLNEFGNQYCLAEGACDGEPKMTGGTCIEIDGIGLIFNGPYYVRTARHIYDGNGYMTRFTAYRSATNKSPTEVPSIPAMSSSRELTTEEGKTFFQTELKDPGGQPVDHLKVTFQESGEEPEDLKPADGKIEKKEIDPTSGSVLIGEVGDGGFESEEMETYEVRDVPEDTEVADLAAEAGMSEEEFLDYDGGTGISNRERLGK